MDLKTLMVAHLKARLAGRPSRLPVGGDVLWSAFQALSPGRSFHANGPNPIAFSEIVAWCQLYGMRLQPHHIDILRALDDAYQDAFFAERKATKGAAVLPHISTGKMTAGLVDFILR